MRNTQRIADHVTNHEACAVAVDTVLLFFLQLCTTLQSCISYYTLKLNTFMLLLCSVGLASTEDFWLLMQLEGRSKTDSGGVEFS